jgi:rubrerythrin
MGYHTKKIQKGEFGHASKIREEYEEFIDAYEQSNPVMELVELSDLIGAIEAYVLSHYDIELVDLIKMKEATQSAFQDGTRSPTVKWKCRRCGHMVDMVAFRCNCTESPSPWEPV